MKKTMLNIARRTPLFPYLRAYYTLYLKQGLGPSLKTRIIGSHRKDILERRVHQLEKVCRNSRIHFNPGERFFYSIDTRIHVMETPGYRRLGNLTPDYGFLLERGLEGIGDMIDLAPDGDYTGVLRRSLRAVRLYLDRCREHSPEIAEKLGRVPLRPAETLEEALQSILFMNSLLWMYGHPLIGLGRLDSILEDYHEDPEESRELIRDFILSISSYYEFKSNVLPGDTGQVIVLGGDCNDLTGIFLEVMGELRLPDPKVVLRVNSKTPDEIWELSYRCLREGLGYPLFSNDDVMVDALSRYYSRSDALNYGTSACWEPLIPGRSSDQNNLANLNLLEPLEKALHGFRGEFDELLEGYRQELHRYIDEVIDNVESVRDEPSPLLSLLFPDCISNSRDIALGGAAYSINGVLTVGMGNLVNSLLNIRRLCYDEKIMDIGEVEDVLREDFRSAEPLRVSLEVMGPMYGMDEDDVVELTNTIIQMLDEKLEGRYKFGLSSPGYITVGESTGASFDGRRSGDPLGVHISPIRFTEGMSYTEVLNFAAALDYRKAFNGGVVDIMVDRPFLDRAGDEFIELIRTGLRRGVMQLQVNVVDPQILLRARDNPELYPDLIVRVWGFSAYFRDLPEEYRDLLVRRALEYSGHGGYSG